MVRHSLFKIWPLFQFGTCIHGYRETPIIILRQTGTPSTKIYEEPYIFGTTYLFATYGIRIYEVEQYRSSEWYWRFAETTVKLYHTIVSNNFAIWYQCILHCRL